MRPEPIIKQAGVNDSEQRLVRLCAGTFLELWSYPNIFRSQHANGDQEGKEVCDLAVVFGDRMLIFSDKQCELNLKGNLDVAWRRWFRRAVRGAERQLRGAERWLTDSPDSIFLDRQCKQSIPVDLTRIDAKKTHRIVVASGASAIIRDWSNGDWPGLVLFTPLKNDHHDRQRPQLKDAESDDWKNFILHFPKDWNHRGDTLPFMVGDITSDAPFVHVFDERAIESLLHELDTMQDFVDYLDQRAAIIRNETFTLAPSEEDLLAFYLRSFNDEKLHCFPFDGPQEIKLIPNGEWADFVASGLHQDRRSQNESSYAWDKLIEKFTRGILDGSSPAYELAEFSEQELAVRAMARESRLQRRGLIEAFKGLLSDPDQKSLMARTCDRREYGFATFIFVIVRPVEGECKEDYVVRRHAICVAYMLEAKRKLAPNGEVVVITTEPLDFQDFRSEHVFYRSAEPLTDSEYEPVRPIIEELNILKSTVVTSHLPFSEYSSEAVATFNFGNLDLPCDCGRGRRRRNCCFQLDTLFPEGDSPIGRQL